VVRRLLLSERQAQLECLLDDDTAPSAKAVVRWIGDFLERFDAAQGLSDEALANIPPEGNHYMEMSSDQSV